MKIQWVIVNKLPVLENYSFEHYDGNGNPYKPTLAGDEVREIFKTYVTEFLEAPSKEIVKAMMQPNQANPRLRFIYEQLVHDESLEVPMVELGKMNDLPLTLEMILCEREAFIRKQRKLCPFRRELHPLSETFRGYLKRFARRSWSLNHVSVPEMNELLDVFKKRYPEYADLVTEYENESMWT
jgi:hypothetical protein